MFKSIAVLLTFAAICAQAQAPTDVRVALVIGNSAYPRDPLTNPVNDAKGMSEVLKGLGFTVIEVRDGSKAQIFKAIEGVRDSLRGKNGVGMLYYAGHGMQVDARNYMVPVDAKLAAPGDVATQTVDVGHVIEAFKAAGNRLNILVLDACRDNPFGSIVSGKGLAPLDAPTGTFLAYATAPGNVASDGDAKSTNGLYTHYLLQELKKPTARIEDVFKRVRYSVRKASNGKQIPWESTSLEEDFQFHDGRVTARPAATAQSLIASFNQEKADWDRIKDSTDPNDFFAFLQSHPNGTIAVAAQERLNQLARPGMNVQVGSDPAQSLPYSVARYRAGDAYEVQSTLSHSPTPMVTQNRVLSGPDGDVHVETTVRMPGVAEPMVSVQVYDTQGGFKGVKDLFRMEPPSYFAPSGSLQVGTSWKQTYQQAWLKPGLPPMAPTTSVAKVVARERVTVIAGTFDTMRVQTEDLSLPGGAMKGTTCTHWMAADVAFPVKSQCTSIPTQGAEMKISSELVKYRRAGGST
jgi:Uncharacterized protein containing caspase domain